MRDSQLSVQAARRVSLGGCTLHALGASCETPSHILSRLGDVGDVFWKGKKDASKYPIASSIIHQIHGHPVIGDCYWDDLSTLTPTVRDEERIF